jgi:hypothetical protein
MHIYYRISDVGYKKEKPAYINNENCLRNFVKQFNKHIEQMVVIADNTSPETDTMILNYVHSNHLMKVSVGHGAGTFNLALDMALELGDAESVYFVENDYLHTSDAPTVLEEGLQFGFSFVTLYDHPDKYLDPSEGGNPFCEGRSEVTRVYRTQSSHWKLTNSTTMTFAAKVSTLRKNAATIRKWTVGSHPYDFQMFLELVSGGNTLASAIPGMSTHGETKWLAPGVDWSR